MWVSHFHMYTCVIIVMFTVEERKKKKRKKEHIEGMWARPT